MEKQFISLNFRSTDLIKFSSLKDFLMFKHVRMDVQYIWEDSNKVLL